MDPNSSGRGVRQFKTYLIRRLEKEEAETKPQLAKNDTEEIQKYYQNFYEKNIKEDQYTKKPEEMAKIYETATVLYDVLTREVPSSKVDEQTRRYAEEVEKNKTLYEHRKLEDETNDLVTPLPLRKFTPSQAKKRLGESSTSSDSPASKKGALWTPLVLRVAAEQESTREDLNSGVREESTQANEQSPVQATTKSSTSLPRQLEQSAPPQQQPSSLSLTQQQRDSLASTPQKHPSNLATNVWRPIHKVATAARECVIRATSWASFRAIEIIKLRHKLSIVEGKLKESEDARAFSNAERQKLTDILKNVQSERDKLRDDALQAANEEGEAKEKVIQLHEKLVHVQEQLRIEKASFEAAKQKHKKDLQNTILRMKVLYESQVQAQVDEAYVYGWLASQRGEPLENPKPPQGTYLV